MGQKQNQMWFRLLVFAYITALLPACDFAPYAPTPPADEPFAPWLDRQMPELLARFDVPGVAMAVMEDGRISLLKGYGLADVDGHVTMTEDHVFNVASVSKAVTAWGVMHLVDQGRIDLDQPVNRYLQRWKIPGSDGETRGITVRRLLSHTGGISMPSTPGFRWPMPVPGLVDILDGNYSDSTYARAGTKAEIVHSPGEAFHYSGGGYLVLQLLIEEITGKPFQEYMEESVLTPLGMTASQFGWGPTLTDRMATPYLRSGNPEDIFRLPGYAASSLHASARDLSQWMLAAALINKESRNRVIADEALQLMLTPVAETGLDGEELGQMGLGYFLEENDDLLIASHSGGNAGWRARVLIAPANGNGILILVNSNKGGALIESLSCIWIQQQDIFKSTDMCN